MKKEIRCTQCDKKLCVLNRHIYVELDIKCSRCGYLNQLSLKHQ
ncbi:Com family DNA-binding transcriptional regulator [Neisseria sp. Ec49-e6-T10]